MSNAPSLQLDALRTQSFMKQRLLEFTRSYAYVRDPPLLDACTSLWSAAEAEGGLVGRLWVEGIFPPKVSGTTLDDLARDGVVSEGLLQQLARTDAFPIKRPLYAHQEQALRATADAAANDRPGIVVTAGTGTGKTEAFLLPLLSDLFRSPRQPPGARAIIVYPMNALVNDQVERIYRWLRGQDRVTLFHFTSETPEDKRRADAAGIPVYEACRIRTRQEARKVPPDVLITNYSMLEYMLCRPQDAVFFGPDLRALVLDEAHLYSGTLAAEITLLLRRVLLRASRTAEQVLTFATSATLTGDVRWFAARLFGKQPSRIVLLEGQSERRALPVPVPPAQPCTAVSIDRADLDDVPFLNTEGLVDERSIADRVREVVAPLVGQAAIDAVTTETRPARVLWEALSRAPLLGKLEEILWGSRDRVVVPLSHLASELWGDASEGSTKGTIRLLQWAARARRRPDELPIVAHKLHLMVRAAATVSACVDPGCTAPVERRLPGGGRLVGDVGDSCPDCGGQMLTLARCTNCGEWLLAGIHRLLDNTLHPRHRWRGATGSLPEHRYARPGSGEGGEAFSYQPATRLCENGPGAVPMTWIEACPTCGESPEAFGPIGLPDALTLPLVAETLLAAMPPEAAERRSWLPADGRRLLVFSDSRREAARLGPSLTRQHEIQLGRAVVARALAEGASDAKSRQRVERRVQELQTELSDPLLEGHARRDAEEELANAQARLLALTSGVPMSEWAKRLKGEPLLAQFFHREGATKQRADTWDQGEWERNRRAIVQEAQLLLVNEFATPGWRRVSLETIGLAEVVYPGLESLTPPDNLLGVLPSDDLRKYLLRSWPLLLASVCDTLRQDGAVTLGSEELDWTAYDIPLGRWVSREQSGRNLVPFVGSREGRAASRRNRFCRDIAIAAACPQDAAEACGRQILQATFDTLMQARERCAWIQTEPRETTAGMAVDGMRLVFDRLALRVPMQSLRCSVTRLIWPRSVAGCAPEVGSQGTLGPVEPSDLDNDPRIGRVRRAWRDDQTLQMGLWAEEHSAQLASDENRRLQDLFANGIRNVLSATTTLELGIDIGGLVGALLGNVPPGRAQYRQRSGRAGRRADGSSLVVTYARGTAFDQSAFLRTDVFFTRPLRKPTVLLDREPFGRRHLHAFLLGEFFRAIYPQDLQVGAMEAFNRMGWLCARCRLPLVKGGAPLPDEPRPFVYGDRLRRSEDWWEPGRSVAEQLERFLGHLGQRPLLPGARRLLEDTPLARRLEEWAQLVEEARIAFHAAWTAWSGDYDVLVAEWRQRLAQRETTPGHVRLLNSLAHQAEALWSTTVIEELGTRQFLPRYGFPIGVQALTVPRSRDGAAPPIRLERAGILAVSEYVPGSSVLVGGRTCRSRGVVRSWVETGFGKRAWMYECQVGHVFYGYAELAGDGCSVPGCAQKRRGSGTVLLLPRYGFTTAAWDPPQWEGRTERAGSTTLATMAFVVVGSERQRISAFGGVSGLDAEISDGGEMLAVNRGDSKVGFGICTRCGYADSERDVGQGRMKLPSGFEKHAPLDSWGHQACWPADEAPVLRNHHLAATQVTDILQLDFTRVPHVGLSAAVVTTLGHALRLAGAELLELDHRELSTLACPVGSAGRLGLLLFDDVAGGAGHVVELAAVAAEWLRRALDVMRRGAEHDRSCVTACLECLLTASSQVDMEAGRLQRRATRDVLTDLLSGRARAETSPPAPGPRTPDLNPTERVHRARQRTRTSHRRR